MDKIPFEDGTLVKAGYVEIDGTKHETVQPEYTGKTPLSAYNLKKMQDNIENSINEEKLVKRINISGASKQETREGYNKFNSDSLIGITPTSTGTSYIIDEFDIDESGIYTIVSNLEFYYNFKDSNDNTIMNGNTSSGIANITITDDNINTIQKMMIFIHEGSLNKAWTKLMLLKGEYTLDNSPEYEQYGASPSIEHEAPIESVGDNINSLAIQDGSWTTNGLTVNVKDNEININGTATSASNVFFTLKESLNLNGRYSFQAGNDIALTGGEYFRLYTGTTGFEVLVSFGALTSLNVKSENINISGTADRLAIRVNVGTVFNNVTFKPKLEKGTKATPYSPHGQGGIGIVNSTENLLDISKLSSNSKNGVTLTQNDNGIIILNGTASDDANFDFYITDIKATTNHKLQLFNLGGSYTNTYVSLYMATDKTWNDFDMLALTTNKITVMPLKEKTYTYARIKVNKGVVCNNLVIGCQVINDVDGTATEYVEGKSQTKALYTQQPFRAIGEVKDTFAKKMGKWHEEHKNLRYIFTGNEGWKKSSRTDVNRYYVDNIINTILNASTVDILCSHFKALTPSQSDTAMIGISKYNEKGLMVNVDLTNTELDTVDKFKAKLTELYNAGTPVYVDYVLATPTLIECTPEQVEVLNDIYSAYGEGMTNIICNDKIEPVIEIVKETKETVQSENDKAISALLKRVSQLEQLLAQSTAVEEEA